MQTQPFRPNTLYYGDCLEVMQSWDGQSVDLIYLDPPFNSKANYNIIFGNKKQGRKQPDLAQMTAFADTWYWDENAAERVANIKRAVAHPAHRTIDAFSRIWPDGSGMLSYLSYMAERIAEMPRLLKDTGSIYLHCDPTASHYLKLIMDEIFGTKNFRNEIIWHYGAGHPPKKDFARKHDSILRYSKTGCYTFNSSGEHMRIPFKDTAAKMHFTHVDKKGRRYRKYDSGKIAYLDEGKMVTNVWTDIDGQQARSPISREYLGYPTQKPLALLERILTASSNEGDVVLDPFCGCGTTVHAAHNLKRKWIGIDISTYAIEVIRRERMRNMRILLEGVPKDLKAAKHFAANNPFDFEKWAVTRLEGFAPNTVQRGDSGIDGRAKIFALEDALAIAQVKGGKPTVDQLKAFVSTLQGGAFELGVFITLEKFDTPTVRKWVGKAGKLEIGSSRFNRLMMWSIDEYFKDIHPKLPAMAHPRTGRAFQDELLSDV
ncbi:MAG: DNA methyltransferase [Gammaproteobacteria bacterium]|nr:DNA methyltransferase [Gammaproteobacteria bacterium]